MLLCLLLSSQEPRFSLKESTLLKTHKAAFFGRSSPGPAAVGDQPLEQRKGLPFFAWPRVLCSVASQDLGLVQSSSPRSREWRRRFHSCRAQRLPA